VALRSTNNLLAGYRASKNVHNIALSHVIRAPMEFFDTNPLGRILNRFSKDQDEMDFNLP
jgi:ABC-type multidrug transport system fused ATPase/permease subunit